MTRRTPARRVGWMLAVMLGLLARSAHSSPSARLTYVLGSGAEQCPDEAHLRRAVAARLGYDPFFPWAKQTVITEIERAKTGYHGRVRILDEHGVTRGERTLDTSGGDCAETVNALALAISIGIDDLESTEAAPEPVSAPASPSGPDLDAPPAGLPEPIVIGDREHAVDREGRGPTPSRLVPFASGRVHTAVGTAPAPALGASVGVGLERGALSLAIEGRADLPASTNRARGTVSSSLYTVSLVPCARVRFAFGCLLLSGGSFAYEGSDLTDPNAASAFFGAAGARLGGEVALTSTLMAFAAADLLGTFTPHRVEIDGVDVYRLPIVSAALGIGLGAHFR